MHFENSDCDEKKKNANTSASEFQYVTMMIRDFQLIHPLKILKRLMMTLLKKRWPFFFFSFHFSAIIRGIIVYNNFR